MSRAKNQSYVFDQCCCVGKVEPHKLVAVAGCAEDLAAVAALPHSLEPRRAGPVLTNYLRTREQQHHAVLQDLHENAGKLNAEIDAQIRTIAENLQCQIQRNQTDMNCVVEDANLDQARLSAEERNEALKDISQLYTKRIEEMAKFKREALALEKRRADGLRTLLRDYFQRLVAVGHQTPKDLVHDFDERCYAANQQLLSNSRAYADLEARLRAQADESVIRAKSSLNQLCLGVQLSFRRHSAQLPFARKQLSTRSLSACKTSNRGNSVPSFNNILSESADFEECVAKMVEAYRNAALNVFTGVSGKLTDLRENLVSRGKHEHDQDFESPDFRELIARTLSRLSEFVQGRACCKSLMALTANDPMSLPRSLACLGEHLRSTYAVLHDAGHLWDAHIMRSALAQKLTMAAVEDLLTSNDSVQLANEIQFNVALEQLRCCPDPDKLQNLYDGLISLLEKTGELYLRHSEAEIGRLEEYMNLPLTMANTLLAEYDCFLELHPRQSIQSGSATNLPSAIPQFFLRNDSTSFTSPLPRFILQSELNSLALMNWKNGFLETFESNVSLVPDELKRQARAWVDEKNAALNMRYSMKMMSHSVRMERVKAARDARLAELRHHEARLASHLEAIFDLIDRLPIEASEFLSIDAPELYPFSDWMNRMQSDMAALLSCDPIDPEVKRLKMCSYVPRLAKHRSLFEESLNVAVEDFKKSVEHRIQAARISNVRFVTAIKLFGEGGRYAGAEASKTSAALLRAADALEASARKTMDCANHRRGQLLALADQRMAPLAHITDDFFKGAGSKKAAKDAPKKKK